MKITLVAGARPNFMKIAPIIRAIENQQPVGNIIKYRLVHTGQHYDDRLSKVFFEQLNLPDPDVNLGAGSGTQAEQTARIMVAFEKDLQDHPCDLVIVVGDVTSTMACTIVAKKMSTRVAHVEGGIRSFDMSMPEEINRMVTDAIADYFFTTSQVANDNLLKEGTPAGRIFFVGNTMIDTLLTCLPKAQQPAIWLANKLEVKQYLVLTLHRPSNVDDPQRFEKLMEIIDSESKMKVVFPIHPRTQKNFNALVNKPRNIIPCEPLSYLEFIYLLRNAKGIITDSGGVQEETTVLGVPCVTMRTSTERPETVIVGTNEIVGDKIETLVNAIHSIQGSHWKKGGIPPLWDGKTGERIISIIKTLDTDKDKAMNG